MRIRMLVPLVLLFACLAAANNKKKDSLPAEVLNAQTVVVLVDPDAGMATSAPFANRTAQEDVEKALAKWGRLKPVLIGNMADLVITVRKGNGKIVQPTVGGELRNDRPIVVVPSDNGIHIGAQQGRQPDSTQPPPQDTSPRLGSEVGPRKIPFLFTEEARIALHSSAVPFGRYVAKNGLRSPDVPAVAEFRKAVDAALKQQQKTIKP